MISSSAPPGCQQKIMLGNRTCKYLTLQETPITAAGTTLRYCILGGKTIGPIVELFSCHENMNLLINLKKVDFISVPFFHAYIRKSNYSLT
jgi:hypothetical protein